MPHIELRGSITPEKIYRDFSPATEKYEETIFKIREVFLRGDEAEILIESFVVEDHLNQDFLVQLRSRESGLMIGLYPSTPVQRTEGIKQFLVWLTKRFLSSYPGLAVGTTNLESEF